VPHELLESLQLEVKTTEHGEYPDDVVVLKEEIKVKLVVVVGDAEEQLRQKHELVLVDSLALLLSTNSIALDPTRSNCWCCYQLAPFLFVYQYCGS